MKGSEENHLSLLKYILEPINIVFNLFMYMSVNERSITILNCDCFEDYKRCRDILTRQLKFHLST